MSFVEMYFIPFCKSTKEMLLAGDELAQVVSCPWIMRDSGGSLAQNHWQGDLGLPAGRQDNAGGGKDVDADCHARTFNHQKPQFIRNNGCLLKSQSKELSQDHQYGWKHADCVSFRRISKRLNAPVSHNPDYFTLNGQTTYLNGHGTLHCRRKSLLS